MIKIRRVVDETSPSGARALAEAMRLIRAHFPTASDAEFDGIVAGLRDPAKRKLRTLLFVAEDGQDRLRGAAIVSHAPDLRFCFLDYVVAAPGRTGGGIGGILYDRVRQEASALDCVGLFFECAPDDPSLSRDPEICRQNGTRLRFYERYGARPIANTKYETPVRPGGDNPPYLVLDPLGRTTLLGRNDARQIVRAILERKYGSHCPPEYVNLVVESFVDDPIVLRPPRYGRKVVSHTPAAEEPRGAVVPIVVNDRHEIHHVHERGYVEAPVRIGAILKELLATSHFRLVEPRRYPERWIKAVHDGAFVDYLHRACARVPSGRSIYPYVFPIRNQRRPPLDLPLRAGYFCMDTFTPLNENAYLAARRAVDCTLTAADRIVEGARFAYSLVRPPGHHAERRVFGGFCYFNNAAIAANYLSKYGSVAVLDIDYHHGNGTQYIFYDRSDVLTVSIHGHPSFAYPYFSGFRTERGEGRGIGYNLNLPLPERITAERYRRTLTRAIRRVRRFKPDYLVLSLGFDTGAGDPTGTWPNRPADFARIGAMIGQQPYPTLIVQEGGYRTKTIGANAREFFAGLTSAPRAAVAAAGTDKAA